jgi:hypothetical protein
MKMVLFSRLAFAAALALASFQLPARAADLSVDGALRLQCGTATGTAGAATLNNKCGKITTESLTTAAAAVFTETITNSAVAAADLCFASVVSAGTGIPTIAEVAPAAGSLVITVQNLAAAAAFNTTLVISYLCVSP